MSSTLVPVYYEGCWSILSSIGLTNVMFGFIVVGIIGLSPVIVVPIVVSIAGAIANGLCYYAFYAHHPVVNTAVAAGFADFFWLIQEAGLSFYSYQILSRILPRPERKIFMRMFWTFIAIICSIKTAILTCRVRTILQGATPIRIELVDHLHIGYFLGIASNEVVCSYFLLRVFFSARRSSKDLESNLSLFSYLTRSTEIRLTILTVIGLTRTVTYSFQTTTQSATNVATQIDRFVFTLECVFPMILYIDILAAKIIVRRGSQAHYSHSQPGQDVEMSSKRSTGAVGRKFSPNVTSWVDVRERSESQEYIVDETNKHSRSDDESFAKRGGINKTVTFEHRTRMSPT